MADVSARILRDSAALLRGRWPALLLVAGLTLGGAVMATSLIAALANPSGAVINGVVTGPRPWTEMVLAAEVDGSPVRLTVPVLLALAWFVGLGASLRLLAGRPARSSRLGPWLWSWLGLGAVLGALALLSAAASVVLAGIIGAGGALIGGLLGAYGLARVALAMPAMLVDGYDLSASLRRSVTVTRGRTLTVGTMLLAVGLGPLVAVALVGPWLRPAADSWVGDVLWAAAVGMLQYLVLVALLPVQVVVLLATYRAASVSAPTTVESPATPADSPTGDPGRELANSPAGDLADDPGRELTVIVGEHPAEATGSADDRDPELAVAAPGRGEASPTGPADRLSSTRWVTVAGLAVLLVVPALVGPAVVLANPRGLPVATVAHPDVTLTQGLLDLTVLSNGSVAMVDDMQVSLCRDAHCTDAERLAMPCYDGEPPEPVGAEVRSCLSGLPLLAADITPDGRLLALIRGRGNTVRLFWCHLVPTADGQCTWGGATSLYPQPELWQGWSLAVTATPDGGFAAAILGPGYDVGTGRLLLATCASLDCPQPTVQSVLDVALADSYPPGTLSIAVDPGSGSLALGYLDRTDTSLWLGGCPAGCPGGPVLNRAFGPLGPGPGNVRTVTVVAGPTGPMAALGLAPLADALYNQPTVDVVTCDDHACTTPYAYEIPGSTVLLVSDDSGQVYHVGDAPHGASPVGEPVVTDWFALSPLLTGRPVAAALGPDGRLRIALADEGRLTLVTCANQTCRAPTNR